MKKLFLSLLTVTLLSVSFANSCLANELMQIERYLIVQEII